MRTFTIAGREANVWTVLALAILAVALVLMWRILAAGGALQVTVVNNTPASISGLALTTGSSQRGIATVPAGRSVTVSPPSSKGQDQLSLLDSQGHTYTLLADYSGDPGGEVTVIVTAASPSGLKGSVEGNSDYFPKGASTLQPASQ